MAATELPFEVSDFKLAAPSIRPGTVPKQRLIEQLRGDAHPFSTVVAPAGYGKTTLLAAWAEADPRPFAWLALDGRDDDAVVFLRYIAAAIHGVAPVPRPVFDALSGPGRSPWSAGVPRVGNALAALERPIVLVLDDLHAVGSQECLDVLAELLRYVPAGSQIAIASRHEPQLPFARLRSHGSVQEFGVADLRLDEVESRQLLMAAGVQLDAEEASALTERTEGWPAGLYLAALSIQAGGLASTQAESFTGEDRFVADYFREELLGRLPAAEARFLTHTSVLDRMCGGLCDALLQTTGSAETLTNLARINGFVVPLDRRGEWYRYHHLFRELLRDELGRANPEAVTPLNARAMTWCIGHAMEEAAVRYGQAAGETETVAGLVAALVLPTYYAGRMATSSEWVSWFSSDELRRYPALAVYGAWHRALTGRPDEAEQWLALADGATSSVPLSDGSATIEPWIAVLRAEMMAQGVAQALVDATAAIEQLPPTSFWIPDAFLARGNAHALLGAVARATDDLEAASERGLRAGAVDVAFIAHAQLALLAANDGAWDEAGRCARKAQALVDETGLGVYVASALVHTAAARVALHEARLEDARAALARAHRLRPMLDHGLPWLSVQAGLELTRAHLALGEAAAARTTLKEAERVLRLRPGMGLLVADASALRERVQATTGPAGAWAMSLTAAELRLLPYLATHLTFPEIASRLFISKNTVKTEAVSIYRKFGVSSRSHSIERAVEVGLLDGSIFPPRLSVAETH